MPDAGDEELEATYDPVGADVVVYGHIHRPFVRRLGERTVANAGSVGLPFDGDARGSYLLISDGAVEVIRVEYAIEAEVAALRASGYPDADRIEEMLRRGRFVPVGRSLTWPRMLGATMPSWRITWPRWAIVALRGSATPSRIRVGRSTPRGR
jgi:diadenosine tetraphosphatase ApaH/serine/threonine PP2A family protein phosphatase